MTRFRVNVLNVCVCCVCLVGLTASRASAGQKNIVETAVAAGSFKTLATALKAADLIDTLSGEGPFTVLAPTDAAFAKLPAGALDNLLKNKDQLRAVLFQHVVSGKAMSKDVVKMTSIKTLLGQTVPVDASKGVRIGSATVTQPDIACSNGVIHVIDTVLLPKNDIVETARNAGSFKTLLTALDAAGLTDTLRSEGPFTVFAPTDDAFAKLPKGTLDSLLKDKKKLASILTYHVVPGQVMAADVVKLKEAKTVQGQSVKIDASSGVQVDGARVIKPDVRAENGVIHVIDTVILPK
ncbi:MAG: beta-Ig-H3/fasciclin [Planctomycetota bacterium]|nr:MAG: beta-Ig-H3/fasciclin [Planctomycetota bacterium]